MPTNYNSTSRPKSASSAAGTRTSTKTPSLRPNSAPTSKHESSSKKNFTKTVVECTNDGTPSSKLKNCSIETFTKAVEESTKDDVNEEMQKIIESPRNGFVRLIKRTCRGNFCVLTMEKMDSDVFDVISPQNITATTTAQKASLTNKDTKLELIHTVKNYLTNLAQNHTYIYSDIKPENVGVNFDQDNKVSEIKLLDYGSMGPFSAWPRKTIDNIPLDLFSLAGYNFINFVVFVLASDMDLKYVAKFQNEFDWLSLRRGTGKLNTNALKTLETCTEGLKNLFDKWHPQIVRVEDVGDKIIDYVNFVEEVVSAVDQLYQPSKAKQNLKPKFDQAAQ